VCSNGVPYEGLLSYRTICFAFVTFHHITQL
jgi:hypothetical protein